VGGLLGVANPRLPFWVAAGLALVNAAYGYFVLPESLPPERRKKFSWGRVNPLGSLRLLRTHRELFGLATVTMFYHLAHHVLPSVFVLYGSYRYGWDTRATGLTLAGVGVVSIIVQGGLVRPMVARFGERRMLLTGLAFGTIYYPVFLLPLWVSFYWQKGLWRFLLGFAAMVAVMVVSLAFTSSDMAMFLAALRQMFGIKFPIAENLRGAWQFWNVVYRYPIIAAFIALSISFVLWPAQKNLATLVSCSAALMLATQFWHAHSGGLALAWYLPLLLLTVFRPNLEDRVATAVVK